MSTDIHTILPEPFDWCDIPAGSVSIKDTEYTIEPFKMGKYPITYAQFQVFVDAEDGYFKDAWWRDLGEHETFVGRQEWPISNHPRERVSFYDAIAFCRWLSYHTDLEINLPGLQQWVWAAQGSEKRLWPWGNEFDPSRCNTDEGGVGKTTPVDQYPSGASPFGVFDMAGNVMEWCLRADKPDVSGQSLRELMGGSWYHAGDIAQTTYCREGFYYTPGERPWHIGFRIVCNS